MIENLLHARDAGFIHLVAQVVDAVLRLFDVFLAHVLVDIGHQLIHPPLGGNGRLAFDADGDHAGITGVGYREHPAEAFDQIPVRRLQAFAFFILLPLAGFRVVDLAVDDPFAGLGVPSLGGHQRHGKLMAADEITEKGPGLEDLFGDNGL